MTDQTKRAEEVWGNAVISIDPENIIRVALEQAYREGGSTAEARIKELEDGAAEREAFVAGFEHCESVGRGYTSKKLEAEALRRYPKSEEVKE